MVPVRRYSAVWTMKPTSGCTGPPANRRILAFAVLAVDAERIQQLRNWNLINRPINHDPERSLLVVLHHQDDRLGKARIAHLGLGDQELTGE